MTPEERIDQLESELRAAIFAGADCLANMITQLVKHDDSLREVAEAIRTDARSAAQRGMTVRAEMMEMAARMLEEKVG